MSDALKPRGGARPPSLPPRAAYSSRPPARARPAHAARPAQAARPRAKSERKHRSYQTLACRNRQKLAALINLGRDSEETGGAQPMPATMLRRGAPRKGGSHFQPGPVVNVPPRTAASAAEIRKLQREFAKRVASASGQRKKKSKKLK